MSDHFIHRNGGGKILDYTTDISPDSVLDQDSILENYCYVGNESQILNSRIASGKVFHAKVLSSLVDHSTIAEALVANCGLRKVCIRSERTRSGMREHPYVMEVVLDGVTVSGPVTLKGPWTLAGPYLIHDGEWLKPPRHFRFMPEGTGIDLGVIECLDGRAHIGCICRPMDVWLERRELLRRIFTRRGWLPEYIDVFADLFLTWKAEGAIR